MVENALTSCRIGISKILKRLCQISLQLTPDILLVYAQGNFLNYLLTNCFIIYFGPPSVTIFPLEDIQNLYNKLTKSILALHIWFQLSCSTHDEYWMNFYEPFTLWWVWYQWFKGVRILWTRMLKNKLNCLEYKLTGPIMMSIVLRGPIKFVLAKFVPMANNRESQKNWKEVQSLFNQKDRQQSLSVLHVYQWYLGEKDTHVLNPTSGIWFWYDSYPFSLQLIYMLIKQVKFMLFKNWKKEREWKIKIQLYHTHSYTQTDNMERLFSKPAYS